MNLSQILFTDMIVKARGWFDPKGPVESIGNETVGLRKRGVMEPRGFELRG